MSNFQLEKEKKDGGTENITVPEVHHLHRHLQLVQKMLVWHHSYRENLLYPGEVELAPNPFLICVHKPKASDAHI